MIFKCKGNSPVLNIFPPQSVQCRCTATTPVLCSGSNSAERFTFVWCMYLCSARARCHTVFCYKLVTKAGLWNLRSERLVLTLWYSILPEHFSKWGMECFACMTPHVSASCSQNRPLCLILSSFSLIYLFGVYFLNSVFLLFPVFVEPGSSSRSDKRSP